MDGDRSSSLILHRLAQGVDEAVRESLVSELLTEYARPVASKIVRRKASDVDDADDILAEVMLHLVTRLETAEPIENFESYVAVVAYNACDRRFSRKYPNRRRVRHGLQYLLNNRDGFAVWQDGRGVQVGGFRRWQFSETQNSERREELRRDPKAFAAGGVDKAWYDRDRAYDLLTAVFNWAGCPVDLEILTGLCSVWWGITDETVALDSHTAHTDTHERPQLQIADTRPDAFTENDRREHLTRLWKEILDLPDRQRAVILLNLRDERGRGVIDLWIVVGIAGPQQISAAIGMTPEEFAGIWNHLPFEDNRIAEMLALTRQQVINLRKSARERLARRMRGF
jgi:RNA polymerase sigma factor (sigma-70 family)